VRGCHFREQEPGLLLLDAGILEVAAGDPRAYAVVQARHTNLKQRAGL